jgi:hypothetical protein
MGSCPKVFVVQCGEVKLKNKMGQDGQKMAVPQLMIWESRRPSAKVWFQP